MATNFQLQAVPDGFPQPTGAHAVEVQMAYNGREDEQMVLARGSEILWTRKMAECRSVATYTPSGSTRPGERSLTHLQGGLPSAVFYRTIAPRLTKDSQIIYIAGAPDRINVDFFTTRNLKLFRDETDKQLRLAKMASPPPLANYVAYWTDAGLPTIPRNGFVFKPDGKYGTFNPKLA